MTHSCLASAVYIACASRLWDVWNKLICKVGLGLKPLGLKPFGNSVWIFCICKLLAETYFCPRSKNTTFNVNTGHTPFPIFHSALSYGTACTIWTRNRREWHLLVNYYNKTFHLMCWRRNQFQQLCFIYRHKYFTTIVSIGWGFVCSDKRCHLLLVLFLNSLERSRLTLRGCMGTMASEVVTCIYVFSLMLCIWVVFKWELKLWNRHSTEKKILSYSSYALAILVGWNFLKEVTKNDWLSA